MSGFKESSESEDGEDEEEESGDAEDGEDEEEESGDAASGSDSAQEEEDHQSPRRASSRLRPERPRHDDCDGDMGTKKKSVRARVATRTHVATAEAARPFKRAAGGPKRAAPPGATLDGAVMFTDLLYTNQRVSDDGDGDGDDENDDGGNVRKNNDCDDDDDDDDDVMIEPDPCAGTC